jgi:hypothetical protein
VTGGADSTPWANGPDRLVPEIIGVLVEGVAAGVGKVQRGLAPPQLYERPVTESGPYAAGTPSAAGTNIAFAMKPQPPGATNWDSKPTNSRA